MDYLHTTDRFEAFSDGTDRLARGLGWLSIGLGLAELIYGRRLGESLGMEDKSAVLRGYGLREIGTGLAIIMADDPKMGVWARVAGDVLDLATLMPALSDANPDRDRVRLAMAAVGALTVLDIACANALHARHRWAPEPPDYGDRSGYPGGVAAARGTAAAWDEEEEETAERDDDIPASPTPANQTATDARHVSAGGGIPASPTPANQTAGGDRSLRGGDGI